MLSVGEAIEILQSLTDIDKDIDDALNMGIAALEEIDSKCYVYIEENGEGRFVKNF